MADGCFSVSLSSMVKVIRGCGFSTLNIVSGVGLGWNVYYNSFLDITLRVECGWSVFHNNYFYDKNS